MIDKQTLLNSFDQAIEQSLTALNADLTALMQDRVNQVIQAELESGLLNNRVERGIANFLSVMVDDSHKQLLLSRITQNTDQFVETTFANTLADTQQMINDRAVEIVKGIVSTLDFSAVIRQAIHTVLSDHRYVSNWPANSIQPHLIDFDNAQISASVLNGGIARNFASSGIADFATSTVLTVLNDRITLKGNLRVDGNLSLGGLVNTDSEFYRDLSTNLQQHIVEQAGLLISNQLTEQLAPAIAAAINSGIDAAAIQVRSEPLVQDTKLNRFVTDSNLQKVGRLRELDVGGEVSLYDTMRVVKNRVGINTIEPGATLDLWDQEVQIIAGKSEANTGYIGLGRPGMLRLGVDRNNAITILPNGGVEIPDLRVGRYEKIAMSVSGGVPTDPGTPGDIIFNSDPKSNGVFAWVCLEGTRWAPVRLDM